MIQTSLSPHVNPAADTEPGYGQLFAVLIRRFPWFLLVFLASVGGGYYVYKKTPPTYKSSMELLVEPNYQGTTEGTELEKNQFIDSSVKIDTATQLNLMGSSSLIKEAVEKLKPEYPEITVNNIKSALSLEQLRSKEDDTATKIFRIEYTGQHPVKTQRVLEAIRQVYLDYNKEQQRKRLGNGLRVVREQKKKVADELNLAEAQLLRFRKSENLTDPATQAKAYEDALNSTVQERTTTRNQYKEAQARLNSLQQQLKQTPQNALVSSRLSQSTRYQALLNEIQKTELAIAQANLRFTENHPDVLKLKEQLIEQKQLLQQEVGRALGGSSVDAGAIDSGEILNQGQLSQTDLNLASNLAETQTNLFSLAARDQSLAQREQQLNEALKKFPLLLAQFNRLQPQVDLSRQRLQQLLKAEQELEQEIDKGAFNWEVVEEPQEGNYLGPSLQQNLMLGGVVGLMLGGIAAFAREAGDDAVRTTAELEKQVAIPLLGTTPKLPPARAAKESVFRLPFGKPEVLAPWTIQVLQSPPRWESLDLIYKNIELLNSVSTFKSLMITSALPDEGKSALALGLAMSAARLHKKVLLIDANLRDPSVHKHLNLPNDQGLSNLLTSDVALPNQITLQSSGSSYIDILTAGPIPEDPANLLSSPRMSELMSAFEENYDLVILDASSVLGLVDALITASTCRGVIMVASIGKVTRTQVAQATAMLGKLNLLGVVANGVSNSSFSYVPHVKQQQLALKGAVEE